MRVIAGRAGGRRLEVPPGSQVRPSSDRVREAVFNRLGSWDVIEGSRVVDLFAGSGSLGIEAWSRGAAHVTFVESDPRVLTVLRSNLAQLGADRVELVRGDAASWRPPGPVDLVLADPPYAFDGWVGLLTELPTRLAVLESDRAIAAPPGWAVRRCDRYGRSWVSCLEPSCRESSPPDR